LRASAAAARTAAEHACAGVTYFLHDVWRRVWTGTVDRSDGRGVGNRADPDHAADVEFADIADGGGARGVDAGRGRLLRVGSGDPRAILGSAGWLLGHGVRDRSHGDFSRFVCELLVVFLSDPEHIGGWRTSRSGHADAVVGGSADDRVGNGGESEKREGRGPDSESRSAVRAGSVRSDDPGVAEAQRGPGSGG